MKGVLTRLALGLLVAMAACSGKTDQGRAMLGREIAVQKVRLAALESRLAMLSLKKRYAESAVRLLGEKVEEQGREVLRLQALAAYVFKATGSESLSNLSEPDREKIYYSSIVAAIAQTGDQALVKELLPVIEQQRRCYDDGDAMDCNCEDIEADFDRCREYPTRLDRTPDFESCNRLVRFTGAPTSAVCISRDSTWLRVAVPHRGRVLVTDYPAPAGDHYYPENSQALKFCRQLSILDKCEAKCDGKIITFQKCQEACQEAWDQMHSGEPEQVQEQDDAEEPTPGEEAECRQDCQKDFRFDYPEGEDFDPESFVDEVLIEKVHAPAPGIYVLELLQVKGRLGDDKNTRVVAETRTVMLRDRNLHAIWTGSGIEPDQLLQGPGILLDFEVLLEVDDDRPVKRGRFDYPVTTNPPWKEIPVRWVRIKGLGRLLLIHDQGLKIYGFQSTRGQPAVKEIPPETVCRAVGKSLQGLPEPFEALCQPINGEKP